MLIATTFVCNGLFIFTSKVGEITNELSSPGIKLMLNLKGFGVFFTYFYHHIFHRCQRNG